MSDNNHPDFAPRYMSVFLRPCPCCGGHADIREEKRPDPPFSYAVWLVECRECGLRTKDFPTGGYYGLHGTPGKAAAEWNRRVGNGTNA